jgi:hypothetical protein
MDEFFARYCGNKPELFARFACGGLFAHYRDAEFLIKMNEFFAKYCGNKPKLFARFACDGLFAHYRDAEFLNKMDEFFAKYCGNKPELFAQIACNSLFAHLFDAEFLKKMDEFFSKYCGNDPKLLHSGSLHSAMSKNGVSHMKKTLDTVRAWPMFHGIKGEALLGKAMRDNSFISAIANDVKNGGSFSRTMNKINESPAFAGNEKALKNLFNKSTLLSEFAKHGERFLTALENEKKESYGDKNKEFATVLARTKRGKSGKITLPEFVKKVKRRMEEQQQPTP